MKMTKMTVMKQLHSLVLSRPIMLILMGLSLGFSLNMLLSSILNNHCSNFSKENMIKQNKNRLTEDNFELHYKSKSEIENESLLTKDIKKQKVMRPRFLSTELGLKEKLFVSVITSPETFQTLGSAINRTMNLQESQLKIVFFMNGESEKLPTTDLSLVAFSEKKKHLLVFRTLKYLTEHHVQDYNWFYIYPDKTMVNREKLEKLIDSISVEENLLIGTRLKHGKEMCDFDAGILVSQGVLIHLSQHLDFCIENAFFEKPYADNLDSCLYHSLMPLNISCTEHTQSQTYTSIKSSFNNVDILHDLHLEFNSYISFSHITSDLQMYKLYRKLSENSKLLYQKELHEIEKNTYEILQFTHQKNLSLAWPLGSEEPSLATSRFDVIRWHYFDSRMIFHDRFEENFKILKGSDKIDVHDILKEAMLIVNKNEKIPLTLEKLVNGYRRFDSSRGAEYVLDLLLNKSVAGKQSLVLKRVHLVRLLGHAEVVPLPYVTENTRVNLVLTVTPDIGNDVLSFIDSFSRTCIESGDNSYLLIVFVYETAQQQLNDIYAVVKSTASFYENKHHNEGRVAWTFVERTQTNHLILTVMDAVAKKIPKDSIVLTCTIGMQLKTDFLNRVRMNTIEGWQTYFPIGYWSYKPNLVYDKPPYPSSILINQKSGHFAADHYDHASFYLTDYLYSQTQMLSVGAEQSFVSLYEMFLKFHSINVFRAVDPALRLEFQSINCSSSDDICLHVKLRSLASRSQLAMLLFEHQQKLDQSQLHVMHQQQGENVLQMKPDMLK